MAAVETNNNAEKRKAGVKRIAHKSMRMDMTPMVDLGFLLITFFVFTTQLATPTAMDIAMPKDDIIEHPSEIGESYVVTVLPNGNNIYCYEGFFEKAKASNQIQKVSLEDFRRLIIEKQKKLDNKAMYKEGREGMMVLIKPSASANYKSVIDALDECTIGQVKKYALLKLSDEEKEWLNEK